jgi:wobble nucleotide-excising tRNase
MIEKIESIKNFGVYKNLSFDAPDFKKYNLIYGWNYSGKTTLSRLFRCIEMGKLHLDFPDAEFEIIDNEEEKIKHNKLDSSTYQFRVFNTDFVNENLYWDNQEAKPIFVLGEEDIELQKEISKLDDTVKGLEKERDELNQDKAHKNGDIERELTNKAREISRIKSSPYNKSHLKRTLSQYRSSLGEYCLDEETLVTLRETINTSSKDKLSYVGFKVLNQEKIDEIRDLLDKTVISQTIDRLKKNPELNNWIRTGLDLHKSKQKCEFCGSVLSNNLLSTYNERFVPANSIFTGL